MTLFSVGLKSNLVHETTSNFHSIKSLDFGADFSLLPEEFVSSHLSKDFLGCDSFELSLKYYSSSFLPEPMELKLS